MKTIYLLKNGLRKSFEFEKLSDLKEEFCKRNILVGNFATVGDSALVGNYAKVGNFATVGDYALVGNFAKVGDYAKVGDSAKVGNSAKVGDSAKFKSSPIYIIGSKHIINYYGNEKIAIGCFVKTFEEWEKEYKLIGKANGYTDEQIEEYKVYIDLIKKNYKICEVTK
jgi:carbonic anhydrase/acetyltransferase-like protein (isoleucine patch superfamily)